MEKDLDLIIQKYSQNPTLAVAVHQEPVFDDVQAFTNEVLAHVTSAVQSAEAALEAAAVAPTSAVSEEFSDEVFQLSGFDFVEIPPEPSQPFIEETAPAAEDQELLKELSTIPDKLAFKIGEVADFVGVKQYVLRYWETEFDALRPKKSRQNQRMYSRKDVENVMLIKKLLYKDKFSIEGARKALRNLKSQIKETKKWDQVADKYEAAILQLKDLKSDLSDFRQSVL